MIEFLYDTAELRSSEQRRAAVTYIADCYNRKECRFRFALIRPADRPAPDT